MTKIFMFDTNAFGELLKEDFKLPFNSQDIILVITEVQKNEIEQIPNQERKNRILEVAKLFENKHTSVMVWGYSKWGAGKWATEDSSNFYSHILKTQEKQFPCKDKKNIIADSIIGATCLAEKYVLVSQDKSLKKIVKEIDDTSEVFSFDEFKVKFINQF